ncbi:MAG TPA: hypothetical protein VKV15_02095 [Bryobacteraceae bacterium]|nr:hypothetical protein [Bryobacteraceae bacterium]
MEEVQLSIEVEAAERFPDALDWKSVFSDTLDILASLGTAAAPTQHPATRWKISAATFNSPLQVTLLAQAPIDAGEMKAAVRAYIQGLRYLESETPLIEPPPLFDENALRSAKHLVSPLTRGVAAITFTSPEFGSVIATQRIAVNVEELIGVKFKAMGALEGILETLTGKGKLKFNIYDPLTKFRTACFIPPNRLDEAKDAFLGRVAVYGEIRYAKSGKPLSIAVTGEIRRLRSRADLPQAKDLEGIDITSGDDPSDYVRRLRDAD